MKNLCIIPARGGSKRIPRKNVKSFLGKPMLAYSIEAAMATNLFDEVMVSTDDDEIAEAHRSGAIHIHDLSMLTGYCAGWSLKQLITDGLGGVVGKITSSPNLILSQLLKLIASKSSVSKDSISAKEDFG